MFDAKAAIGPLAQTNYYAVSLSTLKPSIANYLTQLGIGNARDFLSRRAGLLCNDASLPASAFTTGEVKGDFMGVPQEFAHTRIYTDIDFTFYVDENYTILRCFEGWMDYISNGADVDQSQKGYYRRLNYPDDYKVDTMYISKFEKNFNRRLDYDNPELDLEYRKFVLSLAYFLIPDLPTQIPDLLGTDSGSDKTDS